VGQNPGTLFALDPATGHVLWRTPSPADGCTTGGAAAYPDICRRDTRTGYAFTPYPNDRGSALMVFGR
jgi:polyvinyl alcohol dehydrogenase (cytochrome)